MQSGEFEKSVDCFEKALEVDPKCLLAIDFGTFVYAMLRNYSKTDEFNGKMINLIENDPEFKKAYVHADYARGTGKWYAGRAKAYYLLGQYHIAIADFQKALISAGAEKPKHGIIAEVHRYLGKIYLKTGKGQDAKKELNKAITLYTRKTGSKIMEVAASGYNGRGLCCLDIGEYDRAISNFEKVIALNAPSYPEKCPRSYAKAHKNLGLVYWKMGESERSNEYLKKALKLFEERGEEYYAKELREALKTGDVAGLLI